jgi:hypothetical protein
VNLNQILYKLNNKFKAKKHIQTFASSQSSMQLCALEGKLVQLLRRRLLGDLAGAEGDGVRCLSRTEGDRAERDRLRR